MKYFFSVLFVIVALVSATYLWGRTHEKSAITEVVDALTPDSQKEEEWQLVFSKLKHKADTIKQFCKQKRFNTKYCFLVDFSRHSGRNRFFAWDLKRDTILFSGLCCHGYGKNSTKSTPEFSNQLNSYCSSLGKYKIGESGYSKWGIHILYKLYGLDRTNSNACRRSVVLHSYSPVPESEIYPIHLPLGWSQGCSVISKETMTKADNLLKEQTEPVILWIYD